MQLSNSAATHMFRRKAPTSLFGWRSVSVEAVAGKGLSTALQVYQA